MKRKTIQGVVILGTLAIAGILIIQLYSLSQAFDLHEKQFSQRIHISLLRTAERIAQYNGHDLNTKQAVTPLSSDYYIVHVNDHIDAATLEYVLRDEIAASGPIIDFEYAIYDCTSDRMLYGNYVGSNSSTFNSSKELPRYDEYNYYFGIRFPGKDLYIAGQMKRWWIFSVLLLIAIVFFAYSMIIILKQKRLSELQKDFINSMTHEFKTPIATIQIAGEVFLTDDYIKTNTRLQQYAQIIKDQNQRLNQQVEKVLQVGKTEREGLELRMEKIDLSALLQTVSGGMEAHFKNKNGALILPLSNKKYDIEGDYLHLSNALFGILDNAVKYCPEGLQVEITIEAEAKSIWLHIDDNGPGIPKKYQKQVFEKFFRIPNRDSQKSSFGLGLFYVKNICKAHHWKLLLGNSPTGGARVSIQFPISSQTIS